MVEAINLIFDWQNDKDFLVDLNKSILYMADDEINLVFNYRSSRRDFRCLMDGCDLPLWVNDFEILRGHAAKENQVFVKMLVHYTCGEHEDMCEAVDVGFKPLMIGEHLGS